MTDIAVRLAVPDDAPQLLELCRQLHSENGLFSFSEGKVRELMDRALSKSAAIMGVIGEVGAPEACIYLSIESPYYSDDLQLCELWNFVAPGFRGGPHLSLTGGHAKRLIEFAKHCSDEMQLPLVIGILSNQRVEAKTRLYERQLEKAGVFFVHNRNCAAGTAWSRSEH